LPHKRTEDQKAEIMAKYFEARDENCSQDDLLTFLKHHAKKNEGKEFPLGLRKALKTVNVQDAVENSNAIGIENMANNNDMPSHTKHNMAMMQRLRAQGYGESSPETQHLLEGQSA